VVWAVAFVVVLGVGVPAAGWWFTRKPRPLDTTDRGYDEIDRWLADRFGLGWRDRSRVREAVLAGRAVSGPALEAAVRGLAAQVVAGRFRMLRVARKLGWLHLAVGPAYAVFGVVVLIVTHQDGERVLGVLGVLNGGLLSLTGVYYTFQNPKRIRRNAEQILRSSRNAGSSVGLPWRDRWL
jgi:hypothetical protein